MGENDIASVEGDDLSDGRTNYFIFNDQEDWRTDIPNYRRVKYGSIYDGVDLVYYGNGRQLEYDFVVQPGRDPRQIKLKLEGVEQDTIDKKTGDLVLETGAGA